ncbi:uncharacterized protein PHACADRAFT_201813 [Phanerochaete carnosa HHB-10118-sp]|uniref:Uncharacterized protein n=1 Tax=Phanerochaete carnosa (strain HHB-10118-sp) TaxID=650164 RepID=K5VDW7_PHACS|nr:uncharacterized protein PHACADRAFT_201813 [Phanerochaete carnosa HHB-10118-sp]EKM49293.1 hypothetical protein PHACADRAFT_201813 [Phanerochaete carnosa HHB-10118-sp]
MLPARPTPDDSLQTPYPTAYRRVKAFLKVLLKAEVELEPKESCKSFIIELGAQHVAEELRRQPLAYAPNQWPFNRLQDENKGTADWWKELEHHPDACALAVRLRK